LGGEKKKEGGTTEENGPGKTKKEKISGPGLSSLEDTVQMGKKNAFPLKVTRARKEKVIWGKSLEKREKKGYNQQKKEPKGVRPIVSKKRKEQIANADEQTRGGERIVTGNKSTEKNGPSRDVAREKQSRRKKKNDKRFGWGEKQSVKVGPVSEQQGTGGGSHLKTKEGGRGLKTRGQGSGKIKKEREAGEGPQLEKREPMNSEMVENGRSMGERLANRGGKGTEMEKDSYQESSSPQYLSEGKRKIEEGFAGRGPSCLAMHEGEKRRGNKSAEGVYAGRKREKGKGGEVKRHKKISG